MLINQTGGIFSQCTCIRTCHNIHFECLTLLLVNHTSKLKLKKKKITQGECIFYASTNQFSGQSWKAMKWRGEDHSQAAHGVKRRNLRMSGRRCGWRQRRAGPLQEDGLPSISWGFPGREGRRVARSLPLLWSYSASRSQIKGRAAPCGFCCTQPAGGLPNGKDDVAEEVHRRRY